MDEMRATGVIAALFALRCLVPLAITLAIGYLMNKQVERWEAEDATRRAQTVKPCWIVRNCDPARRNSCPAFKRQGLPCWEARLMAEERMPVGCATCPQYAGVLA